MSQFKEGSRDQSVIIVDENNVLTSTNLLKVILFNPHDSNYTFIHLPYIIAVGDT